jgi:hypothetical protein
MASGFGVFVSAAVLLALGVPASADGCLFVGTPEITIEDYYVDQNRFDDGLAVEVIAVVYEESNDISGMQRSDPGLDDTCGGVVRPDTLLVFVRVPAQP